MLDLEIRRINSLVTKLQSELKAALDRIATLEKLNNVLERKVFLQNESLAKLDKYNEMYKKKLTRKHKKQELTCLKAEDFTEEHLAKVKQMAVCMTKEQIAKCFNMSLTTYVKREEELPALKEAFESGKHLFMAEATSKLVEHIRNNDIKMLQYYLNNVMKLAKEDSQAHITICKEFLEKPLKVVSGDGNYEEELLNKYKQKIMSISVIQSNSDEVDE